MKKILAIVLCISLVMSLALVASANSLATTISNTALINSDITITNVEVVNSYDVTVTYESDKFETDSQIAIVAYYLENATDVPTEDNIVYIDQFKYDGTGTYTFPMYATATRGEYKVLMGATGLEIAGENNFTIAEPTIKYGDVSGDNKVKSLDAAMVQQYVLRTRTFSNDQKAKADVDLSDGVNALDVTYIKKAAAGAITLPIAD